MSLYTPYLKLMSKPVNKLAVLGPQHSFSHELAQIAFPSQEISLEKDFQAALKMLSSGKASCALLPFYNSNHQSVREAQIELIKFRDQIFVTDILSHKICHAVGGHFDKVELIKEIRSKTPVFLQTSSWITKNAPTAKQKDCSSTSLAISTLATNKASHIAAIGSKAAFEAYKVPIHEDNIQNTPNITLFFVLSKLRPLPINSQRILMIIDDANSNKLESAVKITREVGIRISSSWMLSGEGNRKHYFFELDGEYVNMDLQTAVLRITNEISGAFTVGGYNDKCIAKLIQDTQFL